MANLNDYFHKSLFVRGLDHPFSNTIAPSLDLSHLTEKQLNNIKFGIWDFRSFDIEDEEYSKVINGSMRLFEKNNGRSITDDVYFSSFIDVQDIDLVKVETDIRIDRNIDGIRHDITSIRDNMFPIGYEDCSYTYTLNEYYLLLSDGKSMVHYTDITDKVEVYELNEENDLFSGFKLGKNYVIDEALLESDEPLISEIRTTIKGKKDILELIKR